MINWYQNPGHSKFDICKNQDFTTSTRLTASVLSRDAARTRLRLQGWAVLGQDAVVELAVVRPPAAEGLTRTQMGTFL